MTPEDSADVQALAETVRHAHAKAMDALGADVHPYSGTAIREWEQQIDAALDELVSILTQHEAVTNALIEHRAALADQWRVDHLPFTEVMAESDAPLPGPDADITERANYGTAVYARYRQRVSAAVTALEDALAALALSSLPERGDLT